MTAFPVLLMAFVALLGVVAFPDPGEHSAYVCRELTLPDGTSRDASEAALASVQARADSLGAWSTGYFVSDHQIRLYSQGLPDVVDIFAPGHMSLAEVLERGPMGETLPEGALPDRDGLSWYRVGPLQPINAYFRSASADFDANGAPAITIRMTEPGAAIVASLTSDLAAREPQGILAIIMDGEVLTAPRVLTPLSGEAVQITGYLSAAQNALLTSILSAPPLDTPFQFISDPVTCADRTPNQKD